MNPTTNTPADAGTLGTQPGDFPQAGDNALNAEICQGRSLASGSSVQCSSEALQRPAFDPGEPAHEPKKAPRRRPVGTLTVSLLKPAPAKKPKPAALSPEMIGLMRAGQLITFLQHLNKGATLKGAQAKTGLYYTTAWRWMRLVEESGVSALCPKTRRQSRRQAKRQARVERRWPAVRLPAKLVICRHGNGVSLMVERLRP